MKSASSFARVLCPACICSMTSFTNFLTLPLILHCHMFFLLFKFLCNVFLCHVQRIFSTDSKQPPLFLLTSHHRKTIINRIPGKSVSLKKLARAFALERQQSPVSYVGIDIVSRTILKIMYRTISN